jgi:SAM-dependent methyltransferase
MKQDLTEPEKALVREKIRERYQQVAASAAGCFRYPTGEEGVRRLGYPEAVIREFPPAVLESFCGVGNPFSLSPLYPGETVLDIGCGAGFDTLVAAGMVGPQGRVVGLDATPQMIARAQANLAVLDLANVTFQLGEAESLPFPDNEFDVILSNGVFNLTLDKTRALQEAHRVLKPGGRLLLADMILTAPLPPDRAGKLDDWYQ